MKEELEDLQDEFALVDLTSKESSRDFIEILLKKLLPIEIRMEQDKNHKAPHLHISYGKKKHVASYSINNGRRLAGTLSNKYDEIVSNWIANNQNKLLQIWKELQAGNQQQYELLIGQL